MGVPDSARTVVSGREGPLSTLAAQAGDARRDRPEPPDPLRSAFHVDRDRILRSRAFRRLKHKTQVFVAPRGDHFRTRMTHSLEVTALARTVSRALGLEEDLTEAIGLGHDIGHAPFGHAGEEALDLASRSRGGPGFSHREHGLRVVECLEQGGEGLNLTVETRDGIRTHSGPNLPASLEAEVVRIVDRIAYVGHDIEDAVRAGVITAADLPSAAEELGRTGDERRRTLLEALVAESAERGEIALPEETATAFHELRGFMFERVYLAPPASEQAARGRRVVAGLVDWYCDDTSRLPDAEGDDALTLVIDHVAGMTDRYALDIYERELLPSTSAQ